jgi:C-lobe and N-lobe beta barrels of Tf-binding protein B
MRNILLLLATSTTLAACGGAGPTSVGTNAVTGAGTTGTTAASTHTFVNPTEEKTYQAIGVSHNYQYSVADTGTGDAPQTAQLYAGNATTARDSGISLTYNPRDGIFDVKIADTKSGLSETTRFQDPVHRTDFGGLTEPQAAVPNIADKGIVYFENGTETGVPRQPGYIRTTNTFFHQKPGTSTKYVSYAGYVRNKFTVRSVTVANVTSLVYDRERSRAAIVYGERTQNNSVPKTGSGTFNGDMLASMIYNPYFDTQADSPSYFQWLTGTSRTTVDFAANSFGIALNGTVSAPNLDGMSSGVHDLPVGSTFTAAGTGRIDLVNAGGFLGSINSASFVRPDTSSVNLIIAGSSVDGAFFGPAAQEVGGSFRIVGGNPDERIDILGIFTGAR